MPASCGSSPGSTSAAHLHGAHGSYRIFPDDPRKARIPDVPSIRADRLPPGGPAKGHSRTVPDLVAEMIAPNGDAAELFAGIADVHAVGVPLIWIVDPGPRTGRIGRGDGTTARLTPADTIGAEPILAGSQCPVRLFSE